MVNLIINILSQMSELVVYRSYWVRLTSASRPQQSEELPTGNAYLSAPPATEDPQP
jgi:hypothetical protein